MPIQNPSVNFEAGEPQPVPYVKIFFTALFGIIATVLLFSMLVKPAFFASLMGADVSKNLASANSLSRVAATSPLSGVITPTRVPSGIILSPTVYITKPPISLTPVLSGTPQNTQILQLKLDAYSYGRFISDSYFMINYECYSPSGQYVPSLSYRYDQLGKLVNIAQVAKDSSCKMQIARAPTPELGYVWSDPVIQTSTRYDASNNKYHTIFADVKLIPYNNSPSITQQPITPTRGVSQFPTKTPTRAPTKVVTAFPTFQPTPTLVKLNLLLKPVAPFVSKSNGIVNLVILSSKSGAVSITNAKFMGLDPNREYRIALCKSGACVYNPYVYFMTDSRGEAFWDNAGVDGRGFPRSRNLYLSSDLSGATIQLREYISKLSPTHYPSCESTACMTANVNDGLMLNPSQSPKPSGGGISIGDPVFNE